jgi:hypothetical protein
MAKYFLPVVFVVILALNAALFAMIMLDLDGSNVTTKLTTMQPEMRRR